MVEFYKPSFILAKEESDSDSTKESCNDVDKENLDLDLSKVYYDDDDDFDDVLGDDCDMM